MRRASVKHFAKCQECDETSPPPTPTPPTKYIPPQTHTHNIHFSIGDFPANFRAATRREPQFKDPAARTSDHRSMSRRRGCDWLNGKSSLRTRQDAISVEIKEVDRSNRWRTAPGPPPRARRGPPPPPAPAPAAARRPPAGAAENTTTTDARKETTRAEDEPRGNAPGQQGRSEIRPYQKPRIGKLGRRSVRIEMLSSVQYPPRRLRRTVKGAPKGSNA